MATEIIRDNSYMTWWQDAKFGLFIHWGLYAKLARGEWVMAAEKIPVKEYEKLVNEFNPVKFDAEDWVRMAKNAGMKYIVITAKHHDGFAMFDSKVDTYNIVDATPFQRDPMKELAKACLKEGLKLCFYYSHVIDWHHPDSIHDVANNTWDYNLEEKAFYNYWHNKALPQIKELLTNYGDIGLLWFDTAGGLSRKDSRELVKFVQKLQPNCLINSRVSHWPNIGDYQSKGDNEIPMHGEDTKPWETPMTLNNSWGYSDKDQYWKSAESIIFKMINIVSKGGNLLLNVGPTDEGEIPSKSVEKLAEIGGWVQRNNKAIYETQASPFLYEFEWGAITTKQGYIFIHIYNKYWPKNKLTLYGIKNNVVLGYFLSDPDKELLSVVQHYNSDYDYHTLSIDLPKHPVDVHASVIALEIEGDVQVEKQLSQQASGNVNLDLVHANVIGEAAFKEASWDFKVIEPGIFKLVLINFKKDGAIWEEAYSEDIKIHFGKQSIACQPNIDSELKESASCQYPYKEVHSNLGEVDIKEPGTYELSMITDKIPKKTFGTEIWQAASVRLRALKLVRI